MAIQSFHRRSREAGRRLRDRGYVPLAVLWHEGARHGEEHEAERLFRELADWEAAG